MRSGETVCAGTGSETQPQGIRKDSRGISCHWGLLGALGVGVSLANAANGVVTKPRRRGASCVADSADTSLAGS
jgi:hypothetical protein